MAGLVCSAQSCVYNDAMYCSREMLRLAARMRGSARIRAVRVFREEAATAQKIR